MKERLNRTRQKGAQYGVTKSNLVVVWIAAVMLLSVVAVPAAAQQTGFGSFFTDKDVTGDEAVAVYGDEGYYISASTSNGATAYDTSGTEVWSSSATAEDLAVSERHDLVYAAQDGTSLNAIDAQTGDVTDTAGSDVMAVTYDETGDHLVTVGGSWALEYRNPTNLTEEWSVGIGGSWESIAVDDTSGLVYAGQDNEALHAYNVEDGTQQWTYGSTTDAVAASNGYAFVLQGDVIHKVDASGTQVDSLQIQDVLSLGTRDETGTLYASTIDGDVHEIAIDGMSITHSTDVGGSAIISEEIVGYDGVSAVGTVDTTNAHLEGLYTGTTPPVDVTGTVTDGDSQPIENATVSTESGTTATTDVNGNYLLRLQDGKTYTITAGKTGYRNETRQVNVDGNTDGVDFQLQSFNESIEIDVRNYIKHGETAEYTVVVDNGTTRGDVTDGATVTSNNTTIVTVDSQAHELVATDDISVNGQTSIRAEYTDAEGRVYVTEKDVTVANATVENLEILPPMWRMGASFGSSTIQAILVAVFFGVFAGRIAGGFAGLAMVQMVMTAGWFAGYVSVGMAMVSLFTALFIGLNMAANIDYTVSR